MNGADSLIATLTGAGVEVCFANPGTSELHLVQAIDRSPGLRPVLGLFEGVCTGAADGYGRMTGKPATTLLHLGAGLANGLANLHNARRAGSPVINLVGEHATFHRGYDAPLTSDIEGLARPMSHWVRSSASAAALAADAAEAFTVASGQPGRIATLIVPADCAWGEAEGPVAVQSPPPPPQVEEGRIADIAEQLRQGGAALLLGGLALREGALRAAARISAATGCRVIAATFAARLERGAGRPAIERLPYFPEQALGMLEGLRRLVLVGTQTPVAFFGHPSLPSVLVPPGCEVLTLAAPEEDVAAALESLADRLGAPAANGAAALKRPDLPSGPLDAAKAGAVVAALMPENAIISDEAATSGAAAFEATLGAPPHDWLFITGGALGQCLPVATGAAVACPGRPVLCLHGDGGAMYTVQALWTHAREGLDIKTIIFANRRYQILQIELARLGMQNAGPKALSMLDLGNPDLDWPMLARGMGVPASRAETAEDLARALRAALAEPGPYLIEAVI